MIDDLTDLERAFCRKHVLRELRDPIGAYVDTFGPLSDDMIGAVVSALLERNDIRLEIHYLNRMFRETDMGQVVIELEEARRKALAEPLGAMDAANISITKAQMLGLVTIPGTPAPVDALRLAADDYPLPGEEKPATVH